MDEDEREKDIWAVERAGSRTVTGQDRRKKFDEVKGICRTCAHAMITRRQYSEVPEVMCTVSYYHPKRMPLDIMECSAYARSGEMSLRDAYEIALILDQRKPGGQYL